MLQFLWKLYKIYIKNYLPKPLCNSMEDIKNFIHFKRFLRLWRKKHNRDNAIVVIGDSHVSFFGGNKKITFASLNSFLKGVNFCNDKLENFCTLHLGPALAYNLCKKGTLTSAREKIENLLESKILNKYAKILCCFGEIDIRVHVLKQAEFQKISIEGVIDKIINNYMEFLLFLKKQEFNVFVWGATPSQKNYSKINSHCPYYGSEEDRNIATEFFNNRLEDCCYANGIGFVSIFNSLINDDYTTKGEFISDDDCHLNQKAWIFAKPKFDKILGKKIITVVEE